MHRPRYTNRHHQVSCAGPILARLTLGTAALVATSVAGTAPGHAEKEFHRSVQLRVGETLQLGVYGGHRMDCTTSTPPNAIQVVQAPRLGALSQRQGVSYVARNSISHTCEGARFVGTAVDYTARAPGADTVALDPVFNNGVAHWVFSVTVLP